jgi:DNA-binding transcriptional LysR family regulator
MDALTSLRVFRDVVEAGSFVKAAERLDISTAMTSKHVANLERQLGVRLLNRTTRHLSLTEAGRVYYEQCREALDILQAAEAAVGSQTDHQPRGVLKITAPGWFATAKFADILVAYRARYPDVLIDLRLENRFVDLVEEGYDMALRATSEPSPTMIVRPLCTVPFVLVGSPDYLKKRGHPRHPAELNERHEIVLPTYTSLETVEFSGPDGVFVVKNSAVLKTNDSSMSLQLIRAGLGLAYFPEWIVARELESGALTRLFPEYATFAPRVYAVYTSRKYMTTKVRTFIDFVSEALAADESVGKSIQRPNAPAAARGSSLKPGKLG